MTKYEWKLNGTVVAATESYEVPASAKDGDEIKLTVTAEDGQTASDTVYVGGLTILYVEPTTAGAANGTGFKYIRATFSTALTELAPSQIEIRRKSDKQLYSVESVVLSADGKFADITLFGDSSAAGTEFLHSNEIYTMKVTQGTDTATLDFELPAYNTEAVVTSVDMSKNKVTVTDSGKTQKPVTANTYNVANKYDGNLGALVGRAVTFGYDSDQNMTSFSLLDQQVVYGYMKGFVPSDDVNTWYYKDALSGEKYYCKATNGKTASIRPTLWIAADANTTPVTYTALTVLGAGMFADDTEFSYVKLVLNPDGTIATATVEKNLPNTLYVKSVNGTIVTQDVNNAFDLKDYIIVRDGDFIATSDLEEGDVLFINTTKKFAEVYVNAVSGEISDVIDGKLSIDGKAYEWYGAQYWDDANSKFVALASKGDTVGIQNSQNYLNSLSTEVDTFIYLGRDGKIKYLEGTPVEEVVTTTRELIIGDAKGYTQSLDNHLRVPAFDGTANDTIDVVDSSLKTMFGDKGTVKLTNITDAHPEQSKVEFEDKDDDAPATNYDFNATTVTTAFPNTYLVDVVRNADGAVTGFKPLNYTSPVVKANGLAYTPVKITHIEGKAVGDADVSDITSSTKKITVTGGKVLSLGSYTNIWYHFTKSDGSVTGSKWALNEFPSAAVGKNEAANYLVYSDGTKATDIVVIGAHNNKTIKTGDTTNYSGIIVGNTKKNDSDGKNKVNTVKMILTDGTTQTFDVAEDAVIATWTGTGEVNIQDGAAGNAKAWTVTNNEFFATAVVRDSDNTITQLTVQTTGANGVADYLDGWTDNNDYLSANRDKVSSKLVTANGVELTVSDPDALLLKYKEEGSTKFKTVTYAEVNTSETKMNVWYHTNYTDKAGKIEADMIVVEDTGKKDVASITLNAITADIAADGLVGTATLNDSGATFEIIDMQSGVTIDDLDYYNGRLYADAGCDFQAGHFYRIIGYPSDTTKYEMAWSNVVGTAAATATTLDINWDTNTYEKLSTSTESLYHTVDVRVLDQFGELVTTYGTPALSGTTGTNTLTDDHAGTLTVTGLSEATDLKVTVGTLASDAIVVEAPALDTLGTFSADGTLKTSTATAATMTFTATGFLDQFGEAFDIADATVAIVTADDGNTKNATGVTAAISDGGTVTISVTDGSDVTDSDTFTFTASGLDFTLTTMQAAGESTLTATES